MASVDDGVESLSERQENELQVLQAIYMDDVVDLRQKDAWKVHRPPEILINLGPQESFNTKEAHVCLQLVVKCPTMYPDVVPELRLDNPKGLSTQQVTQLAEELRDMCMRLTGEVMILDLCQYIQKYLHAHNKPPSRSFYDEMITNRRKQEEKTAREQEKKTEMLRQKEAQLIEDEIQKRQEALREDARKRRELAKTNGDARYSTSSSDPSTPSGDMFTTMTPIPKDTVSRQRSATSPGAYAQNAQSKVAESASFHKPERRRRTSTPLSGDSEGHEPGDNGRKSGIVNVVFNTKKERKINMGRCLGHSPRGSSVYVGLDMQTGDLVAVSEWVLKWRHINRKLNLDQQEMDEKESNKYMKQIASLEKETFALLRLSHRHLIHYHAFKYSHSSGKITLHLLMDYAGGGNLSTRLKRSEPLQMDLLRCYSNQALDALVYLHNKAVVHKDLKPSCFMFDHEGKLRLGDISLVKRLTDLVQEVNQNNSGVKYEDDFAPTIGGRGGKKADIYRFGLVMLSLAQGHQVTDILADIPTSLPQEFQDFLSKCLMKDEFHRWTAQQLLDHSFVKTPLYVQPSAAGLRKATHNNNNNEGGHESEEDSSEDQVIPFIPASDSGSRLQNEFDILKWLGKGGFGDVIKVKNKLDGRFYAIKRIPLNPTKKEFTKKITREVKLLSMLNHENVVRYYNSWIETSTEPATNDDSSSSFLGSSPTKSSQSPGGRQKLTIQPQHHLTKRADHRARNNMSEVFRNSLGMVDEWEKNAPSVVDGSIEWSVSVDITRNMDDDDSSEDEDFVFGTSMLPRSDSEDDDDDGIVFEHISEDGDNSDSDDKEGQVSVIARSNEDETDSPTVIPRIQFLYIQMEFCEKSTLRNCIDAGLYEDVDRVWRLFREVVEGLVHIHQQGMIHRDLKPVNIFLDSNDHVKIGDFGLATTDILTKQQTTLIDFTMNSPASRELNGSSSKSESLDEVQDLTGKVGTALYVAPEMTTTSKRVHYSQKVDIYSLGVMFFEMCHHPLPTGMERVQILSNLRQPAVHLPQDFDEDKLSNQASLLRLLLSHDPNKRPTATEILQSEYVPPPQMEEAELNEVLRSTIANPDSKLYKRMIDAIFTQPITPAMDFAYDNELYKVSSQFSPTQALTTVCVADTMERIFKIHGAVKISVPLLMPSSKLYEGNESYVCFMDHIGGLVALPHDLKTPFARFIARYGISDLKRYTVEKVYRENRVYGLHPKELLACSFDIVTPTTASFVPDAEVISVVFEMISEFPVLLARNYYLRINHTCLLKGILLHCGVPEELHQEVYAILGDTKNERQKKMQIQTRLYSLSLSDTTVDNLYHFVETEGQYSKVASMLRRITKTKGVASSLASKGLKEMEAIINHTESLGLKVQVILTLGLISNVKHFSGAIFQIVRNIHKKNKQTMEVLAAGGRYDNLVSTFRKPGSSVLFQCVVGVSISLDRVMAAASEPKAFPVAPACDVVVCSLGSHGNLKEKLGIAKELWAGSIRTHIIHDYTLSLEEIQDQCRKAGISHVVILKDSEIPGHVKLRSLERDKFSDKKSFTVQELVSYLQQKLQVSTQETTDQSLSQNPKTSGTSNQMSSEGQVAKETRDGGRIVRHQFNLSFIHEDLNSKTGKNTRRNYESQIYSNISSNLSTISTKCKIEIVAVDLTTQVLKTMAAFLDLDADEQSFNGSIGPVVERHPRHRKYLTKIFDHLSEIKYEKNIPVIVLYGLKDDSYRVLL